MGSPANKEPLLSIRCAIESKVELLLPCFITYDTCYVFQLGLMSPIE